MSFVPNKTKMICTVGPASQAPGVLEELIRTGMNVVRLNFSHGDFSSHGKTINDIRAASRATGIPVAIMADLPGPKIRIGELATEPVDLVAGRHFTLTTDDISGDISGVSVNFPQLPDVLSPGDRLFINDGIIHLKVLKVHGSDVQCEIVVGGVLRSRKGVNIPDIELGISAFTDHDKKCLAFALENGVDAVSQSFVENASDIQAVRKAANEMGYHPLIIAKIERSRALDHLDEIIDAADGLMVARGDLGVEIPIENIAIVQKRILRKANKKGKPVITATQMLESMTSNRRPTRAEATDVANAILDGTDCVMLSGESAVGSYPVESLKMLISIASVTEMHVHADQLRRELKDEMKRKIKHFSDLIAMSVDAILQRVTPSAVIVPTKSGFTARRITRFRLPVWVVAVSSEEKTCCDLLFSYGVAPVLEKEDPPGWRRWIQSFFSRNGVTGNLAILTEGPSAKHPKRNYRLELIEF